MMTQMEAALNGSLKKVRVVFHLFNVNELDFYEIHGHYCNIYVSDEK